MALHIVTKLKKKIFYPYIIGQSISKWKDRKIVLIVSTGRTGTKFFEHFFNQAYKNIHCVHEPYPDLSQEGADYFKGKIDTKYLKYIFFRTRGKHLNDLIRLGKDIYIESNGGLCYILPVLQKILPSFKVIHVVRNPKDWVRSAYSRKIKDSNGVKLRYKDDNAWKLKADELKDNGGYIWKNMNLIEKLAWTWKTKNENILRFIENNDGITVRFEDIFYNEHKGLENILHYISDYQPEKNSKIESYSELIPTQINSTDKFEIPTFEKWDMQDQLKFNAIASPLMSKLGYT